jgi:UDP-2,4-diacetamido-2,4,6-trideoxy-beta-L-altropyranose hydrolase
VTDPGALMSAATLVVRADATIVAGTGHVMRCVALAHAWQDKGGDVIFAMAQSTPALDRYLRSENVVVANVEFAPGSEGDAIRLTEIAREYEADWLIVDGYHFRSNYQRALKESNLKLLFVDDAGGEGHYFADVILNQNSHAGDNLYRDREAYTQLLLGPQYTMLRRQFMPWSKWLRTFPTVAKSILITMGGSDPDGLSLSFIKAFARMRDCDAQVTVVVGGSNPSAAKLRNTAKELDLEIKFLTDVRDMAGIMAESDLAVICCGGTLWEALYMGCATLTYSRTEVQRQIVKTLSSAGVLFDLGPVEDFEELRLQEGVKRIISSVQLRQTMAQQGRKLVDGLGTTRVLRTLWKPRQ